MNTVRLTTLFLIGLCSFAFAHTSEAQEEPRVYTLEGNDRTDSSTIKRYLIPTRSVKLVAESTCGSSRGVRLTAVTDAIAFSFASNSDSLTQIASQTLDALGKALISDELKNYRFQIEGHTDDKGNEDYNCRLSQRRAQRVIRYLTRRFSIGENRLLASGYGELKPIADNETDEGRYRNRRVQIINLGLVQ